MTERVTNMPKTTTMSTLRPLVHERARGRCEACGLALGAVWECHHRQLRGQGGRDELSNLLALHPECHHNVVHALPRTARGMGWLVSAYDDPATVPVHLYGTTRRVYLNGAVYVNCDPS